MELLETRACFGGTQQVWSHAADTLQCDMRFAVYLPPAALHEPRPVLYFLSGLTCTEQNFITKAGAQRYAAEHGLIIVAPDTSPRGEGVADDDGWDLGTGAGFYLNATQTPWSAHYRMYDYVTQELPAVIAQQFNVQSKAGVCGHSMGGHGALVLGLRNPQKYQSISAISPIVAPTKVPWGQKAFRSYLGDDRAEWQSWDACELVRSRQGRTPLLVDQGTADTFLDEQLRPSLLQDACVAADHPLELRMHEGYDHSYYFIATVVGDHIAHHARALG